VGEGVGECIWGMHLGSSNMGRRYKWGWCGWLSLSSAGGSMVVSVEEEGEILVGILHRTVRGL